MGSQPKWIDDLIEATKEWVDSILRDVPPPCEHRYCERQSYGLCMGVAGAQMDMLEDNGWPEREAFLKVAAGIFNG